MHDKVICFLYKKKELKFENYLIFFCFKFFFVFWSTSGSSSYSLFLSFLAERLIHKGIKYSSQNSTTVHFHQTLNGR